VIVTLTSVPDSAPLEAEIVEISSLPDTSAVAQYAVSARIVEYASSTVRLRDGMLTDIEIVQEEKENVVRVPVSALSYSEGKAHVTVLENLSKEQEQQFARLGIVRTDGGTHTTYTRTVMVGLRGTYYAEIIDGLVSGERIVISTSAPATDASEAVVRTGLGAGMGGGRPPEERDE
jgi:multidrug efflux pump subunit AcrA (membrane-fusion protein)